MTSGKRMAVKPYISMEISTAPQVNEGTEARAMNNRIRNQMKAIRMCRHLQVMATLRVGNSPFCELIWISRSNVAEAKEKYGDRLEVWDWW